MVPVRAPRRLRVAVVVPDTDGRTEITPLRDAVATGLACKWRAACKLILHDGNLTTVPSIAVYSRLSLSPHTHSTSLTQLYSLEYTGLVYVYKLGQSIVEILYSFSAKHPPTLHVHVNVLSRMYDPTGNCAISGTTLHVYVFELGVQRTVPMPFTSLEICLLHPCATRDSERKMATVVKNIPYNPFIPRIIKFFFNIHFSPKKDGNVVPLIYVLVV